MTTTYNPKLGDANRYENARMSNKDLAKKINQEASSIVKHAEPLIKKVMTNPNNKNSHDPITGSMHIGDFLKEQQNKIYELYGIACTNTLKNCSNIPEEIIPFLKKVYKVLG